MKQVTISVQSGQVTLEEAPSNLRVVLMDYDIQEIEPDRKYGRDANGDYEIIVLNEGR